METANDRMPSGVDQSKACVYKWSVTDQKQTPKEPDQSGNQTGGTLPDPNTQTLKRGGEPRDLEKRDK